MRLIEFVDPDGSVYADGWLKIIPVPDTSGYLTPDGYVIPRKDGSYVVVPLSDTFHLSEN